MSLTHTSRHPKLTHTVDTAENKKGRGLTKQHLNVEPREIQSGSCLVSRGLLGDLSRTHWGQLSKSNLLLLLLLPRDILEVVPGIQVEEAVSETSSHVLSRPEFSIPHQIIFPYLSDRLKRSHTFFIISPRVLKFCMKPPICILDKTRM